MKPACGKCVAYSWPTYGTCTMSGTAIPKIFCYSMSFSSQFWFFKFMIVMYKFDVNQIKKYIRNMQYGFIIYIGNIQIN